MYVEVNSQLINLFEKIVVNDNLKLPLELHVRSPEVSLLNLCRLKVKISLASLVALQTWKKKRPQAVFLLLGSLLVRIALYLENFSW